MEDDFEDYWATVRPNRESPKKPGIDLKAELREHASRMTEAMEEMTGRRSPPTSEMLDDFTDSLRFAITALPAPEADAAPRLYVDTRDPPEQEPGEVPVGGVLRFSSGGVTISSDGGLLSVSPGGSSEGLAGIRLPQISGNSDFNLQDRFEIILREQANLLGRVLVLEQENREQRAHIASVESVVRNQRR